MKTKLNLSEYSFEELRELNALIVRELKSRNFQTQLKAAMSFTIGQKVSFDSKYGYKVVGSITKINQKTIAVSQENSTTIWSVSPSLLSLA